MQMRDAHANRWPSTWGFFGGGVEEGETLLMTVVREAKEELDIDIPEPMYFKHYDGETADADIFLLEVDESFPEQVTVLEGEYGQFLPLSAMDSLELRDHYRRIMKDLKAHFGI